MPTGTTSFMMDCDTTGIEPPFELVSHKGLAGGGHMTIVNQSAMIALDRLEYSQGWARDIIEGGGSIMRSVGPEHAGVFATAGEISPEGHVKMVAAVQPFISGAPSKTVNLPASATREDVRSVYELAWRSGCKCVSVFRAESKVTSILSSKPKAPKVAVSWEGIRAADEGLLPHGPIPHSMPGSLDYHREEGLVHEHGAPVEPYRRKMDRRRRGTTDKLDLDGHQLYLTHNRYEEGGLGEVFITGGGKEGSFLNGMMGAFSIAVSFALQYGVPLEALCEKFIGMEFAPKGRTEDPDVPVARSYVDYIFSLLAAEYLDAAECEALGVKTAEVKQRMSERLDQQEGERLARIVDETSKQVIEQVAREARPITGGVVGLSNGLTKPCHCGGIMRATGSCYVCDDCLESSGCG
jgi:ribonucleoside-diphosphate reductase alpha chain